jgi:hypothetical protein
MALDHLGVRRHAIHVGRDARVQLAQACVEQLGRHEVGQAIVGAGHQALAEQHGEPAVAREEAVLEVGHVAARVEQAQLVAQAGRQLVVAHVIPQRLAEAPIGGVVQDQEIADTFVEAVRKPVEFAHQALVDATCLGRGQQAQHVLDGLLDQEQAGGLQRLEEAAGEPERHAIALPGLRAAAGAEFQQARLALRATVERA